jgi:hypothetical protein
MVLIQCLSEVVEIVMVGGVDGRGKHLAAVGELVVSSLVVLYSSPIIAIFRTSLASAGDG